MLSPDNNMLVALNDVSLNYETTPVLRHIDMRVCKNDFIVITGVNGCGKTSILRVLLKLTKPSAGEVVYYQNGLEVERLSIGYLSQKNILDSRFPIRVEEVIASGLCTSNGTHYDKNEVAKCVAQVMEELELTPLAHRSIGKLSGGQMQRTLLGRAIISQPQLLVLDEPLSYIDEAFTPHIFEILARISKQSAVIMVTHFPTFVESLATQMLKVEQGHLVR